MAISLSNIASLVREIFGNISAKVVKNKIYCMITAGWVGSKTYSNKTYFFVRFDRDPFEYAFAKGVVADSYRRKSEVSEELLKIERAPTHVLDFAYVARASA